MPKSHLLLFQVGCHTYHTSFSNFATDKVKFHLENKYCVICTRYPSLTSLSFLTIDRTHRDKLNSDIPLCKILNRQNNIKLKKRGRSLYQTRYSRVFSLSIFRTYGSAGRAHARTNNDQESDGGLERSYPKNVTAS
ncbi:hypothetical protein PUN28_007352 [Cardiocondyla obscurior]|uniref:Uncharacterized protein n=1 Tax=Cardiocondyla obscurior TaxID=286306 RepID=A0AAW2G2U5_9HYME